MRSEDLSVTLRRRNPWEALDLGTAMVRRWWRPLYGAWLLVLLPVALVLLLVFGPTWGGFLLWWLKPLLDRVALHVLATAVFATPPSPKQTLRALRARLGPGVLWSLTLRRFDPARSFNLPIVQLEGQSGAQARERRKVLHRYAHSYAVWLTVAFMHFEFVLFFAALAISDLLVPASANEGSSFFSGLFEGGFQSTERVNWFATLSYVASLALLEPMYVASGFALYLNRRTLLEGWDLEVQFRRLAETLRAAKHGVAAASLMASTLCVAIVLTPSDAYAQSTQALPADDARTQGAPGDGGLSAPAIEPVPETRANETNNAATPADDASQEASAEPSPQPPTPRAGANEAGPGNARSNEEIQQHANRILTEPEFGKIEKRNRLRYVGPWWDSSKKREQDKTENPFGDPWNLGMLPSELFRVLAYLLIAIALGYIALVIYRNLGKFAGATKAPYRPPQTLFGLDVRPESLPKDIRAAALRLARNGELRAALALLYRASLVTLIQKDHVELQGSDTEHECVDRAAKKISPPRLGYLTRLVSSWERVAYAQEPVPADAVIALCEDWPTTFETAQ